MLRKYKNFILGILDIACAEFDVDNASIKSLVVVVGDEGMIDGC